MARVASNLIQRRSLRLWQSRIEGALQFLEELRGVPPETYDAWTRGMVRHYKKELSLQLAHPPEGQQVALKDYLARYRKL